MKKLVLLFLLSFCINGYAQNQKPQVSNIRINVLQRTNQLEILYDLFDAENDTMEVFLTIELNTSSIRPRYVNTLNASGNLGKSQTSGLDKKIIWGFESLVNNESIRIIINADDYKTDLNVQELLAQVDTNRMKADMDTLAGVRHYLQSPARLQKMKDSLVNRFNAAGLELEVQSFQYQNYSAQNFMGTHYGKGQSADCIIMDGHYDGVSAGPAADDNLSAMVGVMEAARILSQYEFKRSLRFIGFDLEELGLLGSKEYVKNGRPVGENIKGVLNFEMIGYYSEQTGSQKLPAGFNQLFPTAYTEVVADSFRGNFITNVGNVASSDLVDQFISSSNTYVPDLRVVSVKAPGTSTIAPDLRRSDHASFWDAGLPAVMLTDGANFRNKNYHTALDVPDSLNFAFIEKVVKATMATAIEMAVFSHSGEAFADTIVPSIAIGMNKALNKLELKLTPNPANTLAKVEWPTEIQAREVQVYDVKGAMVYCAEVKGQEHYIFTEHFAPGTYVLKLLSEGQELQTRLQVGR